MTITTVGSLVTHSLGATGQLSVTLDASPAVVAGDLIVWTAGSPTGTSTASGIAPSTAGSRAMVFRVGSLNIYQVRVNAWLAVGGEEGDTYTSSSSSLASGSWCALRVLRPTTGYRLDLYGNPTGMTATYTGTATSSTLSSSAANAPRSVGVSAYCGSDLNSSTLKWDGEASSSHEYRSTTALYGTKIYSSADTADAAAATLGSGTKCGVLAVFQEIQTGSVIPWL